MNIYIIFYVILEMNFINAQKFDERIVGKYFVEIEDTVSYKKIAEVLGDLDNDGVNDKVVVFQTNINTEFGFKRELCIYKGINNSYKLWYKSNKIIGCDEAGGMIGDPFEKIYIKNKCVVICQNGGDYNKWYSRNILRWQNEKWQLIGLTLKRIFPLNYVEIIDYNLSTGMIIYEKQWDGDNQYIKENIKKKYFLKLDSLPSLDEMSFEGRNKIQIPDSDIIFYF